MPGSIAKRDNGKWRARYRDDNGREHSRHFDRKVDAQRWLDEITTSVVRGSYVDPRADGVTFDEFYAEWSARQIWVHRTRVSADNAVSTVQFGHLPMSSIRRSHVETWVKAMTTTLAPTTIKTRYVIIRSVFRAAVLERVISDDPSVGVTLPRRRRAEAAMSIPTPAQVGLLLEHAESRDISIRVGFRTYVALCAFAGLRLGEAAAVQVGDLDADQRQLSISRQVQIEGTESVVRGPKFGSERVVFIPDELVDILREHIAAQIGAGPRTDQWLFSINGQVIANNTVGYCWRTTRAAAGLDQVRLHDLRHFYASGLIAEGCDVVTVQRSLGHAAATTTLNTYGHLWPTAGDRTRAAASQLAKAALKPKSD
ncbi:site-specific integrase [Nocardioides sp. C4-1]|uniref:tyrosine-type recombinase/integrase n=1 Tax=Nocardioides sp. C4-1 TaxID=3151851 RepID=UPI0032667728